MSIFNSSNRKSLDSEKNFREVFDVYYFSLVTFALGMVKNRQDAEDLVQDVFITVWEKTDEFNDIKELKPYLYRSVRNKCLNYLRDNKVQKNTDDNMKDLELSESSVLNLIIKEEVYQQLHLAFDELPPQCKKIYRMSLDGMKVSEIAEELNLSVETIKTQKKRAKVLLRNRLGKLTYLLFWVSINFS